METWHGHQKAIAWHCFSKQSLQLAREDVSINRQVIADQMHPYEREACTCLMLNDACDGAINTDVGSGHLRASDVRLLTNEKAHFGGGD